MKVLVLLNDPIQLGHKALVMNIYHFCYCHRYNCYCSKIKKFCTFVKIKREKVYRQKTLILFIRNEKKIQLMVGQLIKLLVKRNTNRIMS